MEDLEHLQKKDSSGAFSSSEQEHVQVGEKGVLRAGWREIHNLGVSDKAGVE